MQTIFFLVLNTICLIAYCIYNRKTDFRLSKNFYKALILTAMTMWQVLLIVCLFLLLINK